MPAEKLSSAEMLERLVAFDTVSSKSNLALIDDVRAYLAAHGVPSRLIPDPTTQKANLFATIGPAVAGGVALSGHTDVVPVEGQPWSSDPFKIRQADGRLYGRGCADMKGFIAVALALAPRFAAMKLKRPIHLCLSYDEEIGCLGAPRMLALMGRELPLPALAIVGEPTSMQVVNAHKGIWSQITTITGRDGHSSAPQRGANAIQFMGRLIGRLEELAEEFRAEGMKSAPPGLDFDPPFTTVGLGRIYGGTAVNIIARSCTLEWEFRPLPGVDGAAVRARIDDWIRRELEPELLQAAPEGGIVTKPRSQVPALKPEAGGLAESLALRLTGANHTETASYAAEAGQFQEAGVSTVLCGPGSIAQAHQPDEFIELAQLAACEAVLLRLADWACESAA